MAILQGLESNRDGRMPRLVDIETKNTFLNFMRGAISSIIEAMVRKRQFRTEHKPWRDDVATTDDGIHAHAIEKRRAE